MPLEGLKKKMWSRRYYEKNKERLSLYQSRYSKTTRPTYICATCNKTMANGIVGRWHARILNHRMTAKSKLFILLRMRA